MRKIIVAGFISLDGVIQAPGSAEEDTEGGFTQGGWTHAYWHDEIGMHFFQAMSEADALLLGRKTWQIHGGAFEPMPVDDPFGDVMNGIRKYVVSTTLKSASNWRNSTLINSNVVESIRQLKGEQGKNILMDGSSVLVHALNDTDLIDEYALHVYPVVLGGGKRLFTEGKRINLKLIEATPLPTGQEFIGFNAGPEFKFNEAISFFVDCKTQEEVDKLWNKLTADGGEESRCGWLKDKYGLSWQIIPSALGQLMGDPDPVKAKRVVDAMLQMRKIIIDDLERAYNAG